MDPQWQPYADTAGRQGRTSYIAPQQHRDMNSASGTHQLSSSAFGHDVYQPVNSHPQPMAVSPLGSSRNRSYSGDVDVTMEDADPYNRMKYPSRPTHSQRPSAHYIPQDGTDSARRYSPMKPVTPSHYPASPQQPIHPTHGQYISQNSSARQSPTRNQYSTPSSYYSTPSMSTEMMLVYSKRGIIANKHSDVASSRQQPLQLPPIQAGDPLSDQYYPSSATAQLNAVFGREVRSPRHARSLQQTPLDMPRGPVPRFKRLERPDDLEPKMNTQPAFRRANPEGGFISVSPHSRE